MTNWWSDPYFDAFQVADRTANAQHSRFLEISETETCVLEMPWYLQL